MSSAHLFRDMFLVLLPSDPENYERIENVGKGKTNMMYLDQNREFYYKILCQI